MTRVLVLSLCFAACFNPTGNGGLASGSSESSGADSTSTTAPKPSTSSEGSGPGTAPTSGTSSGTPSPTEDLDSTSPMSTSSSSGSTVDAPTNTTSAPDPICGNGVVEADEACDDGNDVEGDGCTPLCTKDALMVFVTSMTIDANFGALEEADAFCTAAAAKAKVKVPSVAYAAWVSSTGSSVLSRLNDSQGMPYIRPDLATVAPNLVGLLDTQLDVPINLDEFGELLPGDAACRSGALAWTGTTASGMPTVANCEAWSTLDGMALGTTGQVHSTGSWSAACNSPCNAPLHLYCIEQL